MTRYVVLCVTAVLLATGATAAGTRGLERTTTCGGAITQPTTITVSHSQSDPETLNCVWTIQATANIKVLVKSNYVNLTNDCDNNNIKIYDGLLVDTENQLATICGNSDARSLVPGSFNTLTVQFNSRRQGNDLSLRVYFADSETVGCGGEFTMRDNLPVNLRPPATMINGREMLNCVWNIRSSENTTLIVYFLLVTFPECTSTAYNVDPYHHRHEIDSSRAWPTTCDSTCGCNFMELWDGMVTDSYKIGSYCGQCSPPVVVTSSNSLGIWMSAVPSIGFSIRLEVETEPVCHPTVVEVTSDPVQLQSPEYPTLKRGINCVYEFQADSNPVHLTIRNLDIQPGTTADVCDKDKVVIEKRSSLNSLGKDYVIRNEVLDESQTKRYVFCGTRDTIELYIQGSFYLNLVTSVDNVSHKGLEIEVVRG